MLDRGDIPLALSYDDVLLVPARSDVASRSHPDTASRFSRRITLRVPIVSANMDTVTESAMAIAMALAGGLGVIHRFLGIDAQAAQIATVKAAAVPDRAAASLDPSGRLVVAAAVGVRGDHLERAAALAAAGADALVVDVAHGHAEHVLRAVEAVRTAVGDRVDVVAGNVATAEGARDLALAGADAVKVGVGPGSACSTRVVAGVGVPQLTAVAWCAEALAGLGVPAIADGGIRAGGDVAKAIAAGAQTVMIGNLLAGADESPGEAIEHEGRPVKRFRGMASDGAAASRPAGDDGTQPEYRTAEGVEAMVPARGPAATVVGDLVGGLRSAMSYCAGSSIAEFAERSRFVRMTPGGLRESHPHDLIGR